MYQTAHISRNRRLRHARVSQRASLTLCRTNGCTTRLLEIIPGQWRCPICGSQARINLSAAASA